MPKVTIEKVEACFTSMLSAGERVKYEGRIAIANAVTWISGAWYAIGDADAEPGGYVLYQCWIDGDEVLLAADDGFGNPDNFEPVWMVVYSGCAVVPQMN